VTRTAQALQDPTQRSVIDGAREKQKIEKVARQLMVEQRKAAEWRQIRGEPALPGAWVPFAAHTLGSILILRSSSNREPSHVQSSEAFGQMCSKATLFQCGSARSHALKQGTWGPCLTRTVLATAVEEEREVAVESQ